MITLRLQGSLASCVRNRLDEASARRSSTGEAVLELDAVSVAEAFRLLAPQAPEMKWLLRFGAWRVTVDGTAIGPRELDVQVPDRAYVSVAPVVAGSGFLAAVPAAVWWTIGSLAVGYAALPALIPDIPDTDHLETGSGRTLFSGPVNSVAQGGAVPLIYGRTRVGSTVVSGGITQERPTGGDSAAPPDIGLGGELPAGAERPRRDWDAEEPPTTGGAASEERSVLRVIDLLGEGEIEGLVAGLQSVFIDGVAVEDSSGDRNIEGVTVQERKGLAHDESGQEALLGFDATVTGIGTHLREQVSRGAPVVRSVPAGYDAARVTLQWPRLAAYDESGNETATAVELRIRSRPSGGNWTTVLTQTVRDLSLEVQEQSWRVERPESVGTGGTWEIEVSRLTEDSTSTRVVDGFYWQRLAGLRDVKQSYPHSAVIGLVMETDRADGVNVSRREYEVDGRRVLAPPPAVWDPTAPTSDSAARYGAGIWDGTMRRVWTDNPAWVVYDLLTDRRAGLGGIPGMVEAVRSARAEFLELSRRCDALVPAPNSAADMEPRWRFNGVIKRREQARKAVDWVLSACRAGALWSAGAASLAIDGEGDVTAALGSANVVDGEFEYQGLRWQERYSAVAVTWQDPDDAYRSGIELVVSDGLVARYEFRQRDVAAVGCTSRGQAHRMGLLALSEQENESETVKFRMALEGMHLRPGDRVRIADEQRYEAPAAFRILEIDDSTPGQETLTLDQASPRLAAGGRIAWGAGQSAAVAAATAALGSWDLGVPEISTATTDLGLVTYARWSALSLAVPDGPQITAIEIQYTAADNRLLLWATGDLPAAWERHGRLILEIGGQSITLPPPDNAQNPLRDADAPYEWSSAQTAEIGTLLVALSLSTRVGRRCRSRRRRPTACRPMTRRRASASATWSRTLTPAWIGSSPESESGTSWRCRSRRAATTRANTRLSSSAGDWRRRWSIRPRRSWRRRR